MFCITMVRQVDKDRRWSEAMLEPPESRRRLQVLNIIDKPISRETIIIGQMAKGQIPPTERSERSHSVSSCNQ